VFTVPLAVRHNGGHARAWNPERRDSVMARNATESFRISGRRLDAWHRRGSYARPDPSRAGQSHDTGHHPPAFIATRVPRTIHTCACLAARRPEWHTLFSTSAYLLRGNVSRGELSSSKKWRRSSGARRHSRCDGFARVLQAVSRTICERKKRDTISNWMDIALLKPTNTRLLVAIATWYRRVRHPRREWCGWVVC
jgi:hypothetical protein